MTDSSNPLIAEKGLVDSVLLIDGDNDPHFPPDYPITENTLIRVFVRPGAKMPGGLEKKLGKLPMCVTISSPKGGANAADFVMSLHAGILHATLPLHLPFTLVTADKSLSVMLQELQRVGRIAVLWTSHPERGGIRRRSTAAPARPASASEGAAPRSGRSRRGGRSRGGRGPAANRAPAPDPGSERMATPEETTPASTPAAPRRDGGRSLADVAANYAARLSRIKDPPSRLKTLLNDIKNRTANSSYPPEEVLEELKRSHGVLVDEHGKVHHPTRGED